MDMHSKVMLTQARIIEFYGGYHAGMEYGGAYVSFSGGKDSTVLLHIARQIYPDIPAVFSNTGLEYPEIRRFAKAHDNVETVQPKLAYNEVISAYGYPLIGKEVAEAIYYARKIRSQDVQVERERERTQTDRVTGQTHLIETSGAKNRRTILMGAYPPSTHTHTQAHESGGSWQENGNVDTETDGTQREPHGRRDSKPKSRGEWQDWRRGCL